MESEGEGMNCEKCVFFNDCSMQDECVDDCKDFEMTDDSNRDVVSWSDNVGDEFDYGSEWSPADREDELGIGCEEDDEEEENEVDE